MWYLMCYDLYFQAQKAMSRGASAVVFDVSDSPAALREVSFHAVVVNDKKLPISYWWNAISSKHLNYEKRLLGRVYLIL